MLRVDGRAFESADAAAGASTDTLVSTVPPAGASVDTLFSTEAAPPDPTVFDDKKSKAMLRVPPTVKHESCVSHEIVAATSQRD